MKYWISGGLAALALTGVTALADSADAAWAPETFTLSNGMDVVVLPDHRAPVVTHMVWYKVGAVDEDPGRAVQDFGDVVRVNESDLLRADHGNRRGGLQERARAAFIDDDDGLWRIRRRGGARRQSCENTGDDHFAGRARPSRTVTAVAGKSAKTPWTPAS